MSNERVTYAELKVAKNSRNQHRKPRGPRSSISVIEQEIIYADFSFQNPSQEHPWICRNCRCKGFPSPPEKLIAGTLGLICFFLIVAVVVITTVPTPYINYTLSSAQTCPHCPKEWISYSHNCYFIGMERKSWNDSLVSCISKNCSLFHIDSEEEKDFLQSLSLVSWTGIFRKSRGQPWVWKKDSIFKPKIAEILCDDCNCAMMSASGLTADSCATLHLYLCKCKFTN
ncbi:NKG2-A/NKG2-B type II integral membrane protein-like isoform X2 [Mus caroli]|uniref:NKG2-A/NKG2-B type II integral membrane protein-like isoform X2 n=1 Tax=Mus caroli TaxID=10089 RepID=A0A6P5PYX3_MUSCR|nr:NKG2-A/NKG2-B type II integral membrane protein-like isoform X2 [Mus caroli]